MKHPSPIITTPALPPRTVDALEQWRQAVPTLNIVSCVIACDTYVAGHSLISLAPSEMVTFHIIRLERS